MKFTILFYSLELFKSEKKNSTNAGGKLMVSVHKALFSIKNCQKLTPSTIDPEYFPNAHLWVLIDSSLHVI